jgi:multiple sugar transport system permease protein
LKEKSILIRNSISFEASRKRFGIYLLLPTIILLVAFFAYPIFYSIYLSTTNYNFFLPAFQTKFVGLANYINLFKDKDFLFSVRISFLYAIITTFAKLVVGFLLALLFQNKIRGFGFFRTVITIPMMITAICAGLIWKYMMQPGFGLINYFLKFFHISRIGWYTEVSTAFISVILVDVWMMTPFVIIVMMSGLASLPSEVYEASSIDGANWWQNTFHITLPLLKPIIIITTLISLIDSFKVFDNIWIMTKGGPARATEIFTIYAYKVGLIKGNLGAGAASSLIILVIILVISVIFIKFSKADY